MSRDAFRAHVARAVAEWREAGGEASHEDLPATWARHYERALRAAGFPGDCTAAARLIEDTFLLDGWEVFPDVVALVERLRIQGWTLGIISNWPATLDATLERARLRHYFAVVVGSGMLGYAKPHAEIFRTAARQLGVEPSRILYVGDSVEHDFVGAQLAGLQTVLLDRHDKHDGLAPRIRSLDALDVFLESASRTVHVNDPCS